MMADQFSAPFVERLQGALPQAVSDAFGGMTEVASASSGSLPDLLAALDAPQHLVLEFETTVPRHPLRTLIVVLRPDDAVALFGLQPADDQPQDDPDVQLRVLAEYTEGAEALASSLAAALATAGVAVILRVSGASLESAASSQFAALGQIGDEDIVACTAVLSRASGNLVPVVVVGSSALAASLIPGPANVPPTTAGASAAERAGALAARMASRRAQMDEPSLTAGPAATATNPSVVAHPFAYGQLNPSPPQPIRGELGMDPILDVALQVRVELGAAEMTLEDVLALGVGSVVELNRLAGEPVDIVVNNRLIARGEVVIVEENFGVRVTEIVPARGRNSAVA
jgi:flagellar motor switch protein FliN/FliY